MEKQALAPSIAKLIGYDIAPIVISWVECFLSQRTFQVDVKVNLHQTAEAISSVPQGSVLGAILFIIYVNDLPDNFSAGSLFYADDAKFIDPPRNRNDNL